jgi:hypothetical protein
MTNIRKLLASILYLSDDRYNAFFAKREENRLALLKEVQEEMQPEMAKKARL